MLRPHAFEDHHWLEGLSWPARLPAPEAVSLFLASGLRPKLVPNFAALFPNIARCTEFICSAGRGHIVLRSYVSRQFDPRAVARFLVSALFRALARWPSKYLRQGRIASETSITIQQELASHRALFRKHDPKAW